MCVVSTAAAPTATILPVLLSVAPPCSSNSPLTSFATVPSVPSPTVRMTPPWNSRPKSTRKEEGEEELLVMVAATPLSLKVRATVGGAVVLVVLVVLAVLAVLAVLVVLVVLVPARG